MSVYLISALLAPAALLSPTCRSASLRVSSGRSAPPPRPHAPRRVPTAVATRRSASRWLRAARTSAWSDTSASKPIPMSCAYSSRRPRLRARSSTGRRGAGGASAPSACSSSSTAAFHEGKLGKRTVAVMPSGPRLRSTESSLPTSSWVTPPHSNRGRSTVRRTRTRSPTASSRGATRSSSWSSALHREPRLGKSTTTRFGLSVEVSVPTLS
mmetsp:Transcript_35764/g.115001  ORF Transcript_35764/g.115001 Transcript_35764/m.115001 type:complete len:212 (+) Transcript_35764:194-829(+)